MKGEVHTSNWGGRNNLMKYNYNIKLGGTAKKLNYDLYELV